MSVTYVIMAGCKLMMLFVILSELEGVCIKQQQEIQIRAR